MTHTMKIRVHPRKRMKVYVDGDHFRTFENESFDTPEIYEVEYERSVSADHSDILTVEEEARERARHEFEQREREWEKRLKEQSLAIGGISNYYGGLEVSQVDGKFVWGIENYDGTYWEEIPKSLYDELVKFEQEHKNLPSPKVDPGG